MIPVFRPLKDRAVATVWSGLAASTIGEDLFRVAVVWIAAEQIGNAAGYVNATQYAAMLVVGLLGAVLMALFHVPLLSAALSLVFILFGAVQLILATGLLLTSDELGEEFSEPVVAALLLYAGMFHIFQGILSLLRSHEDD